MIIKYKSSSAECQIYNLFAIPKGAHDLLAEYAKNAFRIISCITLPQPTPSPVSAKLRDNIQNTNLSGGYRIR